MDHNIEWTTAVGEAFLDQPADVMNSIQRLRAEALAAGNLTNTPQQEVVQEESGIRIVPAQPDVIYVPQYDPDVVYVQPYSRDFGPLLTFEMGFAVGSWLNYDCDWGRRSIYVGQWRPGWNRDRNWDHRDRSQNNEIVNVINIKSDTARQWQPSANGQRQQAQHQRSNRAKARSASVSNALVADHEPGGPSTPDKTRRSDLRARPIPKPSHPDFTSQRNERIRRDLKDSNGSSKTGDQNVPEPTATANVPGESDKLLQGGGQRSDPRKASKQAQRIRQSNGGASNQPEEVPATVQPDAPQKHQKRDEHSQSSDQSKSSAQSPNGQKHQQKQARQSAPSFEEPNKPSQPPPEAAGHKQDTRRSTPSAEQNKPSQPPPEAARDKQDSRRSTPSAEQNNPSQPPDASHGKGKGGGEKKSDKKKEGEKKDKGDH
jgi:hypothetical protein